MTLAIPALMVLMALYIVLRARRLPGFSALMDKNKLLGWLACIALPAVLVCPFFAYGSFTAAVVMLHLFAFWVVCDLLAFIVRKLRRGQAAPEGKRRFAGYVAIIIAAAYLGMGWANAHNVRQTEYSYDTVKELGGPVKIAVIADSHLGVTLDGEKFAALLGRIQACEPDLLVIAGDFVDDDSTKADMEAACRALGEFEAPFGVFFVYGNHDNGYYSYRDFSSAELAAALEGAGVRVLRDECEELACGITVAGRLDRTFRNRKSAPELTEALDKNRFILMLDHQPNDYDAEAASGADLVVSGHTHGGHIFPAGQIGLLMGANDRRYGCERRGNTDFIVTSGVSGWAIPFKTGTFSEFVIINIE